MWKNKKLDEILSLEYGSALRAQDRNSSGSVPVVGSNGIDGYHSTAFTQGPGIVVGRKGSAGKVTWYSSDFWPIDTTYYVRLKEEVNLRWVFYLLNVLKLEKLVSTGGVPGLNRNDAYRLSFSLPSPWEQNHVVEILDQADALRRKRIEADAKTERILPALFLKMFGDPVANPKGWGLTTLKKCLRQKKGALQSGPFGTHLHNSDFVEHGTVLAVGIDNVHDTGFQIGRNRRITSEKFEELKKYQLEPGDVLVTIMGTIGRTCVFPEWAGTAFSTKHIYRIQTDLELLHPEYLCAYIRFSRVAKTHLGISSTGQIVAGITSKDLEELPLEVPPPNVQGKFVQLKKLLDLKDKEKTISKNKLDTIFQILLSQAFSGNLTAKWRKAQMNETLAEMEHQTKVTEQEALKQGRLFEDVLTAKGDAL